MHVPSRSIQPLYLSPLALLSNPGSCKKRSTWAQRQEEVWTDTGLRMFQKWQNFWCWAGWAPSKRQPHHPSFPLLQRCKLLRRNMSRVLMLLLGWDMLTMLRHAKTPKKFKRSSHSPSWHRWQQFTPPAGSLEEQEVPSPSKGLDSEAEQESIVFACFCLQKKPYSSVSLFLARTTSI